MSSTPSSGILPGQQTTASGTPLTKDEWVRQFAMSAASSMAAGTLQAGPGSVFTQEFMKASGLNISFDPADYANGPIDKVSQNTYQQLLALGNYIADNWDSLTPEQQAAFAPPKTAAGQALPTAPTPISDANLQAQTQKETTAANNQAMLERQREQNTWQGGENTKDREQEFKIKELDRAEFARQFDLNLAEDRRQFNATTLVDLFKMGVDLAAAPTDWMAMQYWLENVNIPVNALTLGSAAQLFGAVPPTGPSAAGPVVGGPAAIDGDYSVAQQLGVPNSGPVSLEQAIGQNGGSESWPMAREHVARATVERLGGARQLDQQLHEARLETGQQDPGNPFWEQAKSVWSQAQQLQQAGLGGPSDGAFTNLRDQAIGAAQQMMQGQGERQSWDSPPALMQGLRSRQGRFAEMMRRMPQAQTPPMTTMPIQPMPLGAPSADGLRADTGNGSTGGPYTGNEIQNGLGATGQVLPPGIAGVTAPQNPAADQVAMQQQAAQGQVGQSGQGAQNVQEAYAALAQQLGMSVDELSKVFPISLMGQTQAPGGVINSPIIQNLIHQRQSGIYNTGPRTGSMFTQLRGFGNAETGIRGGQDVNAANYFGGSQLNRDMQDSVFKALGQSVGHVREQMIRSSPITDLAVGSQGRRVLR